MTPQSMEMEMLGIASQSVEEYEEKSEEWLAEYEVLADCWKCEDWLAIALESYRDISSADRMLRKGAEQGKFDLTHTLQDLVIFIYEQWLKPGRQIETWIDSLTQKQQRPKNADDMLIAINAVRTLVETRKVRRAKIKAVNNAHLQERAKTNSPPDAWFNAEDGC